MILYSCSESEFLIPCAYQGLSSSEFLHIAYNGCDTAPISILEVFQTYAFVSFPWSICTLITVYFQIVLRFAPPGSLPAGINNIQRMRNQEVL